jgi:hypothetical protein
MSKSDSRRGAEAQRRGALDYRHRGTRRWSGSRVPTRPISCRSPRLCPSAREFCCMNAACSIRVPGRWRAMETDTVFVGAGDLSPLPGLAPHGGDGTQHSRAGLSSVGPPGLGPRLCRARGCRGVLGSNLVLPFEFSIPMPIPIPIPTRVARGCRAGSSSAVGVSGREVSEARGNRGDGSGTDEGGRVRAAISLLRGFAASRETGAHLDTAPYRKWFGAAMSSSPLGMASERRRGRRHPVPCGGSDRMRP